MGQVAHVPPTASAVPRARPLGAVGHRVEAGELHLAGAVLEERVPCRNARHHRVAPREPRPPEIASSPPPGATSQPYSLCRTSLRCDAESEAPASRNSLTARNARRQLRAQQHRPRPSRHRERPGARARARQAPPARPSRKPRGRGRCRQARSQATPRAPVGRRGGRCCSRPMRSGVGGGAFHAAPRAARCSGLLLRTTSRSSMPRPARTLSLIEVPLNRQGEREAPQPPPGPVAPQRARRRRVRRDDAQVPPASRPSSPRGAGRARPPAPSASASRGSSQQTVTPTGSAPRSVPSASRASRANSPAATTSARSRAAPRRRGEHVAVAQGAQSAATTSQRLRPSSPSRRGRSCADAELKPSHHLR